MFDAEAWTADVALQAARMAGPVSFPEFLALCVPAGFLTRELFDRCCDAYDLARAEREIASLPEADPKEGP